MVLLFFENLCGQKRFNGGQKPFRERPRPISSRKPDIDGTTVYA